MQLIDTSALYDLISGEKLEMLLGAFILDLTVYEFGNAVWKQHTKLKAISFADCQHILSEFRKLPLKTIRADKEDLLEILEIAKKSSITMYDASYIYYAKRYSLELLSADKKLLAVWKSTMK